MNTPNRDLLVLTGKKTMNASELEHHVELLNDLLYQVECHNVCSSVNEILDVNRYKIIDNPRTVQQMMRQKVLKPFVFLSNKN